MPTPALEPALDGLELEVPLSRSHPERLRKMVRDHFAFIWRSVRRLGVREADADDLTQRVFVTASRKLAMINPGAERAFLFTAARREVGHHRRSLKRRAEVGEESIADRSTGGLRPDELAGHQQALAYVGEVLETMPDDLRVVFVLFEVEGLSSEEIGELIDIPIGTVKSRLRRAREHFAVRTEKLRNPGARSS